MARTATPSTRKLSDTQRALLPQCRRNDLGALAVHAAAAEKLVVAQERRTAVLAAAGVTYITVFEKDFEAMTAIVDLLKG